MLAPWSLSLAVDVHMSTVLAALGLSSQFILVMKITDASNLSFQDEPGIMQELEIPSYLHYQQTCYITSACEVVFVSYLRRKSDWVALKPLLSPDGGIRILIASFEKREAAYAEAKPANTRRKITESLRMVTEYVVQTKRWWKPQEHGNWLWLTRMIAEEESLEVQAFFGWAEQETALCAAGHEYTQQSRMNVCDLQLLHGLATRSLQDGVSAFAQRHSSIRCRSLQGGLGRCELKTDAVTTLVSLPIVLIVELPAQLEGACWIVEPVITIGETTYELIGRIAPVAPDGFHFTALTIHNDQSVAPFRPAVYSYDDMQGVSKLKQAFSLESNQDTGGVPLPDSGKPPTEQLKIVCENVLYSQTIFYVARGEVNPAFYTSTAEIKRPWDGATPRFRHNLVVGNDRILGMQMFPPPSL